MRDQASHTSRTRPRLPNLNLTMALNLKKCDPGWRSVVAMFRWSWRLLRTVRPTDSTRWAGDATLRCGQAQSSGRSARSQRRRRAGAGPDSRRCAGATPSDCGFCVRGACVSRSRGPSGIRSLFIRFSGCVRGPASPSACARRLPRCPRRSPGPLPQPARSGCACRIAGKAGPEHG